MNDSAEAKAIESAFKVVCDFCRTYPTVHGGLPSSDPRASRASEALQRIEQWLRQRFSNGTTTRLEIRTTRGVGAFPRVPWIVMLPPEQQTSAGIYVAICFGKEGAGAVAGCAQSVTNPQGLTTVTRTRRGEKAAIDVDGSSAGTHYNNAFANPLEVFAATFDFESLESHLSDSIALALTALQKPSAHWIFQGNPLLFDVDQYLNRQQEIRWSLRQHRSDVHIGDKVLIWRSGENSGVVAICVVQSEPDSLLQDDAPEIWHQQPPKTEARCKLEVLTTFTDRPITRDQVRTILPELSIIKHAQGTNFSLSAAEYAAIVELQSSNSAHGFSELLRHYCDEKIIYRSSSHKHRYAIDTYDSLGVTITRLDANEPQRLTFAKANQLLRLVEDSGTVNLSEFGNTSAVRNTIVQAEPLALNADHQSVSFVPDHHLRLSSFLAALGTLHQQDPHYKPVMLLCVLDGIEQQELLENRITFDWIAPRFIAKMSSLNRTVTASQAAQPFFHLSSDLFWMHAAQDIHDIMRDGSEGPVVARSKIRYALLKQTYWSLLHNPKARAAVRQKLETLIMPTIDTQNTPPVHETSFTEICRAFERDCSAVMQVTSPGILRLTSALLSKRFVIFTGLAGSGKTKLAQAFARWITTRVAGVDPFVPGTAIPSANVTYYVTKSDSLAVEFRNSEDTATATIVTLARTMINEWVNYIRAHDITEETPARTIREKVKSESQYSDQLHSFETHLKAAAFAVIKHEGKQRPAKTYALIPVGADWIGSSNVLGYPNGLDHESYFTSPALNLILDAKDHPNSPHFMILDEMNLSHVERYFADVLSAIESDEAIPLHQDKTRIANGRLIPSEIALPHNLFIIGTVNIDETTYMFSPKVLDRANVIEFRMGAKDLELFIDNPTKPDLLVLDSQGQSFGKAFVEAAKHTVTVPAETKTPYEAEMLLFFNALQPHGAEFGYRTAYEAARFVHFYKLLGNHADNDETWFSSAFDCVVFQKLLPKLHGSRARLGPLLKELWFLCVHDHSARGADPQQAAEAAARSTEKHTEPNTEIPSDAPYPMSAEKIGRMWRLLNDNGFTSFAEA